MLFKQRNSGRNRPFSPRIASSGLRVQTYQSIGTAVQSSASTVPKAAPATPIPAPGIVNVNPRNVTSRVGKMRK